MKLRQKVAYYNQYIVCRNRKPFFATIYITSATCQNCCTICLNITKNISFVARPSIYCNKMTN
jgi:hypothetical protein